MATPFDPYDVCVECAYQMPDNCAQCPMRKWNDAVPKIERVAECIGYVKNGGLAREDVIQLSICQDMLEIMIGRQ